MHEAQSDKAKAETEVPTKPASPCSQPHCPAIAVKGGRCAMHQRQQARAYDALRGTPAERGYDSEWRKLRDAYIAEHPVCEVVGCGRAAEDVHHEGPTHAPYVMVALCHSHHSRHTARTKGWGRGKR